MSIILVFVALGCGINFEKLESFAFVIPFKTLALDVIPMWRGLGTKTYWVGKMEKV